MFDILPFGTNERNWISNFDAIERSLLNSSVSKTSFKIDIIDNGTAYVMEAELPGFKKENIHVDLNGEYLVVKATHENTNSKNVNNNQNYVHKERVYGSYERSFHIPNVNAEAIEATYQDGVLHIVMPKKEEKKQENKAIVIK